MEHLDVLTVHRLFLESIKVQETKIRGEKGNSNTQS